jgi:hypothetical protein
LLTAKNASSGETPSREAVVEVAGNMKIILLACKGKVEALLIKTLFFRGEMKKHSIGHSRCHG